MLRAQVNLEPEAYSDHSRGIFRTFSYIYDGTFCKDSALSYILGNEASLRNISLIFHEVTFWARKVKRPHSKHVSYILGNEIF